MHHAAVHVLGGLDDAAACPPLDVADEADAAGVLLPRRIVEALWTRQAQGELLAKVLHESLLRGAHPHALGGSRLLRRRSRTPPTCRKQTRKFAENVATRKRGVGLAHGFENRERRFRRRRPHLRLGRRRPAADAAPRQHRADGRALYVARRPPAARSETVVDAAVRECREEACVAIDAIRPVAVLPYAEGVNFLFETTAWHGSPAIGEPERCDGLSFAPADQLPTPTAPFVATALECLRAKRWYRERPGGEGARLHGGGPP